MPDRKGKITALTVTFRIADGTYDIRSGVMQPEHQAHREQAQLDTGTRGQRAHDERQRRDGPAGNVAEYSVGFEELAVRNADRGRQHHYNQVARAQPYGDEWAQEYIGYHSSQR